MDSETSVVIIFIFTGEGMLYFHYVASSRDVFSWNTGLAFRHGRLGNLEKKIHWLQLKNGLTHAFGKLLAGTPTYFLAHFKAWLS